jgi:hypothetical protein
MEEHLPPAHFGQLRRRPQRDRSNGTFRPRRKINDRHGIGEVLGRVEGLSGDRDASRSFAWQVDAPTQIAEEREVARHVLRVCPELSMQTQAVDDADLVRARVTHALPLAVAGADHVPRIGGPLIHVVEQHGIEPTPGGRLDDAQGTGVHPAPIHLRRGELIVGQCVNDVCVPAVRGHADPANGSAAVRQRDVGRDLQIGGADGADFGGDNWAGGGPGRQEARDQHELSVRRARRCDRFPAHGQLALDLLLRQVDGQQP